jgi:hypothetical protein
VEGERCLFAGMWHPRCKEGKDQARTGSNLEIVMKTNAMLQLRFYMFLTSTSSDYFDFSRCDCCAKLCCRNIRAMFLLCFAVLPLENSSRHKSVSCDSIQACQRLTSPCWQKSRSCRIEQTVPSTNTARTFPTPPVELISYFVECSEMEKEIFRDHAIVFFRRRLHLVKRVTLKGDLVDAVEQFLRNGRLRGDR